MRPAVLNHLPGWLTPTHWFWLAFWHSGRYAALNGSGRGARGTRRNDTEIPGWQQDGIFPMHDSTLGRINWKLVALTAVGMVLTLYAAALCLHIRVI